MSVSTETRLNRAASAAALALLLQACGGGGGGGAPTPPPPPQTLPGLDDPNVYSANANASLPGATEAAAVTQHSLSLGGQTLNYQATAGHLIAREIGAAQRPQAAVFYVAYTLPGANAATRPVTFFYNGGPGSASVWLQLGSFGPKRLVSGVPETTAARPFPLVDNADSLLAQSDLVFVNAVGSGRSQAIAPFTNRSFWGVNEDASLFRDFIRRYVEVNGRQASPKFLYGESYGGPRTAVLARRLQEANLPMDGLVLQSPAMDYNSNCAIFELPRVSCAGYLPSYAAVGAWHRLSQQVPTDLDAWTIQARQFAAQSYEPAAQAFLTGGSTTPALWPQLANLTGLGANHWQAQFNLPPTYYRENLLPGQLIGRYDGRMLAPVGSALAAEGDPSSTWIGSSFASAINTHLSNDLQYRNGSTYVLLSNAIQVWNFSYGGRDLPDTIPDLAWTLQQNPRLRVLAISGYHDLATPFYRTEQDLARLNSNRVQVRNYPGGHMSFLDDATRVRQKADLVSFYAEVLAARGAAAGSGPQRQASAAAPQRPYPDQAGALPLPGFKRATPEPEFQAPMRDPWVPPRANLTAPVKAPD
ncbi:S10 family peptidase [Inhella proteolytica]|uniref:Peptidase S10 n=1 Tax=Inhella proteolytica TaxID=2795029 RepID=A0A931NCG3_9BURK|nr:peptidase S10 [Inhella proteolytica]MBH9575537.1 peptidase S10 [Inhella proteolytica]